MNKEELKLTNELIENDFGPLLTSLEHQEKLKELRALPRELLRKALEDDEREESIENILSHFFCSDVKELEEACNNYEVGDLENYVHYDSLDDYLQDYVRNSDEYFDSEDFSRFTASVREWFFEYFEKEVRQRMKHYILSSEDLDYIADKFHEIATKSGLE